MLYILQYERFIWRPSCLYLDQIRPKGVGQKGRRKLQENNHLARSQLVESDHSLFTPRRQRIFFLGFLYFLRGGLPLCGSPRWGGWSSSQIRGYPHALRRFNTFLPSVNIWSCGTASGSFHSHDPVWFFPLLYFLGRVFFPPIVPCRISIEYQEVPARLPM